MDGAQRKTEFNPPPNPGSAPNEGFSLLELTVVTALITSLTLVAGTVWISALNAAESQESFAAVSAGLREVAVHLREELYQASADNNPDLTPPVAGVRITGESASTITFQKPLASDGSAWSRPITITLNNEDINNNIRLDAGEDANENGVLDRVVERLSDDNGNGTIDRPNEARIIGHHIRSLSFSRSGRSVDVALTASTKGPRVDRELEQTDRFTIVLGN